MNKELISRMRESALVNEEVEVEVRNQNGDLETFSVLKLPVENGKGNIVSFDFLVQDITEIKKLRYLSFHDLLSGLYNRNFFEEEAKRIENGRFNPVGLIICDLDNLKSINDSLGHKEGDNLLISFSKILEDAFRKSDVVARIGGDEFAVLLFNTTKASLKSKVCHLRKECQSRKIGVSIGLAISDSSPIHFHFSNLFLQADEAMYEEKKKKKEHQ